MRAATGCALVTSCPVHRDNTTSGDHRSARSVLRYTCRVPIIAQRQLRNDNADVMRRVEAGETFIVTRNGVPVAELRPLPHGRERVVGRERLLALSRRLEPVDPQRFRRDLDDIAEP